MLVKYYVFQLQTKLDRYNAKSTTTGCAFFVFWLLQIRTCTMKYYVFLCISLLSFFGFSQEETAINDLDQNYREDQFYFAVTYNLLANKPESVSQQGFSSGFHFGFIRDMPFNKGRNWSVGLGLGLSINSYNQNLRVSKDTGKDYTFTVIDDSETDFTRNRYFTYLAEVPLELRWRNSNATSYKFWRIYSGVKFGYVFVNRTKYVGDPESISLNNVNSFENIQYGLTLGAGYNTWNFHLYYGLNGIFDETAKLEDGSSIDMKTLKIGLIFYIL